MTYFVACLTRSDLSEASSAAAFAFGLMVIILLDFLRAGLCESSLLLRATAAAPPLFVAVRFSGAFTGELLGVDCDSEDDDWLEDLLGRPRLTCCDTGLTWLVFDLDALPEVGLLPSLIFSLSGCSFSSSAAFLHNEENNGSNVTYLYAPWKSEINNHIINCPQTGFVYS